MTNQSKVVKHLYQSASTLSLPYLQVGERIKPGSVTGTFTNGNSYTLYDDSNGNLRDALILTSSFASESRNILYVSFNNEFRTPKTISSKYDTSNIVIYSGVDMTGGVAASSGHYLEASSNTNIRIPHEDKFNKFNRTDDWTISFLHKNSLGINHPIISKGGIRKQSYYDPVDKITKTTNKIYSMPSVTESYAKTRTPFVIGVEKELGGAGSGSWHFHASNGTRELHISSSAADYKNSDIGWKHISVRNSASVCEIFIDGTKSGTSGTIPGGITANNDDIIIGAFKSGSQNFGQTHNSLAEMRMYDYACSNSEINSLSNRHYLSASLYQTNVAGNVFYRNGQIVVTSPLSKYNTGSGAFDNTFNVSYKGTHTIYENEVLVRVPKDQYNVTMNPSATYELPTNSSLSQHDQSNVLPGPNIKTMFMSGSAFPYITTIGLYNNIGQLLAVSKLAQPIQKRDDIDMNFIVRWDY